jgi:Zinc finger, C3HC4 type (RING finger)
MPSCSFCHCASHNIQSCNNSQIVFLFERIKLIYVNIFNLFPFNENSRKRNFIERICRLFDRRELCVLSVRYAYSLASYNKARHAEAIYGVLSRFVEVPVLLSASASASNIQNHIERQNIGTAVEAEEEEEPITWYLDYQPYPIDFVRSIEIVDLRNFNTRNNKISVEYKNTETKLGSDLCFECPICFENKGEVNMITLNCNHDFCDECIINIFKTHKNYLTNPCCALCRADTSCIKVNSENKNNNIFEIGKQCGFIN